MGDGFNSNFKFYANLATTFKKGCAKPTFGKGCAKTTFKKGCAKPLG